MPFLRFYSRLENDDPLVVKTLKSLQNELPQIVSVDIEKCFHIDSSTPIDASDEALLRWLLKQPLEDAQLALHTKSSLADDGVPQRLLIEIGPRFNFSTPASTNCVNICHNVGLRHVTRVEVSTRYLLKVQDVAVESGDPIVDVEAAFSVLGDRMTECRYLVASDAPACSFDREHLPLTQAPWQHVPLLAEGRSALERVNAELGLAFSDWDLDHYAHLFGKVLARDPTTVELFDCAQSNSEHSRHWFFRGKMIIDGVVQPQSLIRMVMDTQATSNANNTIKFSDNSSAMQGFTHLTLQPDVGDAPARMCLSSVESDLIFTAETHNMPTAVAPFSGATTGTGGRLRDVQGVGRGGLPIAGTAGYCVGCLKLPGQRELHEQNEWAYPKSFVRPLQVLLAASDGASDYGNKFGEPLIAGFVVSYGLSSARGERDEYVKPIMFSGGLGTMPASMRHKLDPQKGMLLAKIGGPVYRIGVGGGAASSVEVQGSAASQLDYNAVQRGDAEMENKLNRVVRACIEMGDKNPICAIHDQGAGGNGNVLKELVEPGHAGAIIFSGAFQLGDPTINALELWAAEYQENNALLCRPADRALLERICRRERCPISFVGVVTGNGRVTLVEGDMGDAAAADDLTPPPGARIPFDMELKHVLGDMPRREYQLERVPAQLAPLTFAEPFDEVVALQRVLALVAVGSKRYLTNKVDRCVGGLVVQQQCVGPLHTPLADYGLVTVSHGVRTGIATSLGAQPLKGPLDAGAMARMSVAEALSNLVFVRITELADVKCSANWMWAAKLAGEGARLYDACAAMCDMMRELRIAVDGGKDSLSMAAKIDNDGGSAVKSPGTLVISTYAPCPDVRVRVTPDLKGPAAATPTHLLWITIEGKFRLGGSALAHAYAQQGDTCPTLERTAVLARAFEVTQQLLQQRKLLAGHDISDGGLVVCLLEMAFGGLSGLHVDLSAALAQYASDDDALDAVAVRLGRPALALLYAEECGWVVEVATPLLSEVQAEFAAAGVPNCVLGTTVGSGGVQSPIRIECDGVALVDDSLSHLMMQWEATSFQLEQLQADRSCAHAEFHSLETRRGPQYHCTVVDVAAELALKRCTSARAVRVAVLREEGVNSEREMMACLLAAGFDVFDVTMSDLLDGRAQLADYRGLVFPGGFSYADTLGSAKGWAANIMFSELLAPQFAAFKRRPDVFSLGICNGCQLMSLIDWVGSTVTTGAAASVDQLKGRAVVPVPNVALLRNKSQRFECRWSALHVPSSNAIMLRQLQGSVLGCWVAHGEGRFAFRTPEVLAALKANKCIALYYADDDGAPTEAYPMNPNGSVEGIAGLCSEDGRHLALMPHPERCSNMVQWPYVSPNFRVNGDASPWQLMFNAAYNWCTSEQQQQQQA